MPKIKFDKITGVVALAYLVLIPIGTYYLWEKIRVMDNDVVRLCDTVGVRTTEASVTPIDSAKRTIKKFISNGK